MFEKNRRFQDWVKWKKDGPMTKKIGNYMQVKLRRKINNLLLSDFISINTVTHDIPLYKIQTESIRFCKQKHFPSPFCKEEKSSFIDKLLLSSRIWLHMKLFSFVHALMEALEKRAIVWPEEWKKNIVDLGASLTSHSEELKAANENQQSWQSQLYPWREVRIFRKDEYFYVCLWGDWWFDFICLIG